MSWFKFGFGKKKEDKGEAAPDPAEDAQEAPQLSDATPHDSEKGQSTDNPSKPALEREADAALTDVPDDDAPSPDDIREASATATAPDAAIATPVQAKAELERDTNPEPSPVSEPEPEPEAAPKPAPQAGPAPTPEERKGFFARLTSGLRKSSSRFSDSVSAVFTKRKLDDEALEELEDLLIAADLGAATAAKVTARLAKDRFDKDVNPAEIKQALADVVAETLLPYEAPLDMSGAAPRVVLFVGVNGSGKTTTLGKIAVKMTREGGDVITAAGDTFRAAAVEQLEVWSKRAGAKFLSRPIGSDAAGLAFDAYAQGKREGADAVLIDTAGRLQNKAELMDELRKIVRVLKKQDETAPHHVILVLDGTVGSNAISQAEAFMEAANVTGVIMTKLDGTAKGGALVQVAEKFGLPIHFIGVGEGEADLQAFDARAFARALAGVEG